MRRNLLRVSASPVYMIILFILVMLGIRTIATVPPGHVGVLYLFGNVDTSRHLSEGWNWKNPLASKIDMSVRYQEMSMTQNDGIIAIANDGLNITVDITVRYRLESDLAPVMFQEVGIGYAESLLSPSVRTAVRDAVAVYESQDIYADQREEFSAMVFNNLLVEIEGFAIEIDRVQIRSITLPSAIRDAIDQKLQAEQEMERMEHVLAIEGQEAERREIEATGIAAANEIINQTLTAEYLSWYYITKLESVFESDNNTVVIMPFDQGLIPLLNVQ